MSARAGVRVYVCVLHQLTRYNSVLTHTRSMSAYTRPMSAYLTHLHMLSHVVIHAMRL